MGRVVLITGISGKFGRVFLSHLLQLGHVVIGTTSTQESLDAITDEYDLLNKNFHGIVIDLCEEESAQKVIDILSEKGLYPDCLINNARSLKFLQVSQSGLISRENFLN